MNPTEQLTYDNAATIGEMVAEDYRKAEIFESYGLDFCCGGSKTLNDACTKKGIDSKEVIQSLIELDKLNAARSLQQNYDELPLDELINHIVDRHHTYVTNSLPQLDEYSLKVAKVHGSEHPEVVKIYEHFQAISTELRTHMQKEENILFPYIKLMVSAKKSNLPLPMCPFGKVSNPIKMMEMEHESAGGNFEAINELSSGYMLPDSACTTYRVLYAKLKEFEIDLHQHIHLENNLLFPKAIKLEKEMAASLN